MSFLSKSDIPAAVENFGPAMDALHKLAEKTGGTTPDTSVLLTATFKMFPLKKEFRYSTVKLVHPVFSNIDEMRLCFFARDPKDKAVKRVTEVSTSLGLINRPKTITLFSLKKKYVGGAERRELANKFDMFVCEDAIFESMPRLLGKYFFETKKRKVPHAVRNITPESVKEVLSSARFRLRGGANVSMRLGFKSMENSKVGENLVACLEGLLAYCEKKKNAVCSLGLSIGDGTVLPIWSVPVDPSKSSRKSQSGQDAGASSDEEDKTDAADVKPIKKKLTVGEASRLAAINRNQKTDASKPAALSTASVKDLASVIKSRSEGIAKQAKISKAQSKKASGKPSSRTN